MQGRENHALAQSHRREQGAPYSIFKGIPPSLPRRATEISHACAYPLLLAVRLSFSPSRDRSYLNLPSMRAVSGRSYESARVCMCVCACVYSWKYMRRASPFVSGCACLMRLYGKNLNAWRVASISTRRASLAGSTLISPKFRSFRRDNINLRKLNGISTGKFCRAR